MSVADNVAILKPHDAIALSIQPQRAGLVGRPGQLVRWPVGFDGQPGRMGSEVRNIQVPKSDLPAKMPSVEWRSPQQCPQNGFGGRQGVAHCAGVCGD
jgi:hypothetical protein